MKIHRVGISSVGSGAGQAVLNSCLLSALPLETIGFCDNPLAYGLSDCDAYDFVPGVREPGYADALVEKCREHRVELLIPSTDEETLILSKAADKFEKAGLRIVLAAEDLVSLCCDKGRMVRELGAAPGVPELFVKSYDKAGFLRAFRAGEIDFPAVAKPRTGFASRSVRVVRTEREVRALPADFVVQEVAAPHAADPDRAFYLRQLERGLVEQVSEISVQLVAGRGGDLLGRMASRNKLNSGFPVEIIPLENDLVWRAVDELYPELAARGLRGPLNLQGRITDRGFRIFEMNARFTGITALRALMGFAEVEASIKHWLELGDAGESLKPRPRKVGVRQMNDRVLPVERDGEAQKLFERFNVNTGRKRKALLVTGATGYLGRNLVERLAENEDYQILAFSRDKAKAGGLFGSPKVRLYDEADLRGGALSFGGVDVLIHAGFARPHRGDREIAASLAFSVGLFSLAARRQVPAIVNISSQGVYGSEHAPPWAESLPPAPATAYAQAKYAVEVALDSLRKANRQLRAVSLRMATLAGGQQGLVPVDLVSKFALRALGGKTIKITARGAQRLERLDVRDAVSAICRLLETPPERWRRPTYNLGAGATYEVAEIARLAVRAAEPFRPVGKPAAEILVAGSGPAVNCGMDTSLFAADFGWRPQYDLAATLDSLMRYFARPGEARQRRRRRRPRRRGGGRLEGKATAAV